ncbi:hypothetical protein NM688_g8197 [Phlebia brevispora]|uniref:Uncharacterized protein n=1 Tax=Phlebia brevispora TaxID=194682 RepID=A0ACC1RW08_9APHY|nr:hypothetical protein NM688_g8197 [Phlebia brevispora]
MYVLDAVFACPAYSPPTGPVYALDWCKTPAPGQHMRARSSFRIAIGSLVENSNNNIAIIGLQDERVLVEDDYADNYPDFITLCEVHHGYPATSLQWQPAAATSFAWSQKSHTTELLASTGDALKIWEYSNDVPMGMSAFVGRQPSGTGHRITLKATLAGVCP